MKKLIQILSLASLALLGCSKRDMVFEDIFKNRVFKIENYNEYVTSRFVDPSISKMHITFDFDKNGKTDLIATTFIKYKTYKGDSLFFDIDSCAYSVGFDKNEDKVCELFYGDADGDNYLEYRKEQ